LRSVLTWGELEDWKRHLSRAGERRSDDRTRLLVAAGLAQFSKDIPLKEMMDDFNGEEGGAVTGDMLAESRLEMIEENRQRLARSEIENGDNIRSTAEH